MPGVRAALSINAAAAWLRGCSASHQRQARHACHRRRYLALAACLARNCWPDTQTAWYTCC
jgi:hypothetical protein